MGMKALVVGGAGFIGSHIVDQLLIENIEVVIIDNRSSGNHEWQSGKVTFYKLDIFDQELDRIFAVERPDVVFHQAAQISVARSMVIPEEDAHTNIIGTIYLLKCAVKYEVKQFIFASSAAVYGSPEYLPVDESHPIQPLSFYGLSKSLAEAYIRFFAEIYNLKYCIFRYANVYGPRQNSQGEAGVIPIFFDRIIAKMPLTIYGDGTQTRDFIYVKDVAAACVQGITNKQSATINLGMNSQLSLNELVNQLMEITGISVVTTYQAVREGDIAHSCLDSQLAQSLLDWQPSYTSRDGLTETYQHLLNKQTIPSNNTI